MVRRVIEHKAKTIDQEDLIVVTILESGINKEQARKVNQYCKKHHVLVNKNGKYDFI